MTKKRCPRVSKSGFAWIRVLQSVNYNSVVPQRHEPGSTALGRRLVQEVVEAVQDRTDPDLQGVGEAGEEVVGSGRRNRGVVVVVVVVGVVDKQIVAAVGS